ncbi:MAG: histidine phosphotransferase family protein [Rhodospirillales bacterium]|nr:histidine phosphotransferase family protein [Rhodospirillales bacterium]
MQFDLKAAQLLCSRICHDLIGPAGAVNTGLELLAEDGTSDDGALALVSDSALQVSRRLAFFRVAFGAGGGVGPKAVSESRDLAMSLAGGGKVSVGWDAAAARGLDGKVGAEGVKMMLAMIFLAMESMPRGGTVSVSTAALPEGSAIAITAAGTGARLHEGVADALNGAAEVDGLTARSIIAHFIGCLADRAGVGIEFTEGRDEVRLAALLPASDAR